MIELMTFGVVCILLGFVIGRAVERRG